ncbi:MAG: LuxR C-terminal-related transcriptional regulator [Desulfobulbaceae bacterium]|nr:LuxR C-terminal-related transcriptional regulator [Desulfobulbaceae bacterium]
MATTNQSLKEKPIHAQGRLIESIYRTVGEPGAWHGLLRELVAVTNSRSARLLVMNREATRVTFSIKLNIDDNYHRQYVEHYVNACPWRPELRMMRPGRLYSTYLHFSCAQPNFYRTEFFNDWARPQNIHHGVCGTVYRDASSSVQMLIQRTRGQGYYTEAETAFLNDLVPHIQQSFLIAGQLANTRAQSEATAIAAGCEPLPFLLLDRSLRVTYSSPGVEELVADGPWLGVRNNRLLITDELQNRRLQRLLRQCLTAADTRIFRNSGGTLAVPRPGDPDLQLLVRPVHPDVPALIGPPSGYVAVYFYDPEARIEIDQERLRELYSLSEAETRVAMAMVDIPDSAEVANRCAISLHTVRSHIKAIFSKTGTHSRADLMKRLLTGPARRR